VFSLKSVYVISHIIDDVEFAKIKLDKIIYLIYRKKHPPFHYSWYLQVWYFLHFWDIWQLHKTIYLSYLSFLLKCQYNKSVTKCKYIRYNVKDYSVVYNNAVRPVIYVRVVFYLHMENTCMTASFH